MHMKDFEFERLSLEKKCRYVLGRCVFVASRWHTEGTRSCRINLYHNGRYFFEIWYNSQYNYMGDVHLYREESVLDHYVGSIDLRQIEGAC